MERFEVEGALLELLDELDLSSSDEVLIIPPRDRKQVAHELLHALDRLDYTIVRKS